MIRPVVNLTLANIPPRCEYPIPYTTWDIAYFITLTRTIPYINTLIRTIPYLNTLNRTITSLNTLSRTLPYLNTLPSAASKIRVLRHLSGQPIRIEYYVTRELSARVEVPSRFSAPVGAL